MYYAKDIESIGGLFIKEKIIKKEFRYEIVKCLLYIQGEKFQVALQEFKKGKGIVLDVIAEDIEEQVIQREKLTSIIEKYAVTENSPIVIYRKKRREIKMKASFLMGLDIYLVIKLVSDLVQLHQKELLFTQRGVVACISLIICVLLIFIIDSMRSRYTRG